MNEHTKPEVECPKSVIKAGAKLVTWRRRAEKLAAEVDAGMPDILKAIEDICTNHDVRRVQAGEAIIHIRHGQAAAGHYGAAHNHLRFAMCECGIAEPTDAQIIACMKDDGEPDPDTESIR